MTLRNLRAYTQNKDDTLSTVTASNYETGTGENARLRKINLNVDIATQAELNEAFNLLSNAITATGTAWKDADVQLSNDLKDWAKGSELSGALHNEITAETNRATTAEEAIRADLSNNYKVTVSDAADQTSSFIYTIKQGDLTAGTINVPKDMFVEGASFQGTVLVLSVRGQDTPISTDLSGLVDEYDGSDDSEVKVTTDGNVISVVLKDTIARVGTAEDLSTANTIYGVKAYADEVAAAVAVSAEGETGDGALVSADDANNMITVGSTQKLKDAVAAAETALQTISKGTDGTYVTTTVSDKGSGTTQTVGVAVTVADLSAETKGLAEATDVKQYVDTAISKVDGKFVKGLNSQTTAYVEITGDIELTGDKIVTVNASEKVTGAVDKVELCASIWDTVTNKADLTALEAEATTRENADKFLSGKIDALSVSLNAADGDSYVSAYVDGNTVKVQTQDKVKDAVNKVADASADWDYAASVANVVKATSATWNEVSAKADLTAVNALSNVYASKTIVDNAGTALETAITAKNLSSYQDIDEIIKELEDLKTAVKTFAESVKTA